ncbi:high-potential iron-sulfur protein (plasmid) [Cupriavidus basilensis]
MCAVLRGRQFCAGVRKTVFQQPAKGDCPLFGGQVAANGWCIAWVKKA